mmetsp:Transcript_20211/g.50334  ORF Transcript_20211/g.50334 Transcript_20211/m.50334 type:complete len:224 (+) Transcript_20211:102-773(+)
MCGVFLVYGALPVNEKNNHVQFNIVGRGCIAATPHTAATRPTPCPQTVCAPTRTHVSPRTAPSHLHDHHIGLEGLHLARHGHVDEARAVLTVRDDEAPQKGGVHLGLELDVLRARHLLDLLGDQKLLLVLELDGRCHGGDLGVGGLAVQVLEFLGDRQDGVDALLVDEEVEEVSGEGMEVSLIAQLAQDILDNLALHGGVFQEGSNSRVGSHVRSDGLHVGVD